MTKNINELPSENRDTQHLTEFGTIFIERATELIAKDKRKSWASLAKAASGDFFKYTIENNVLKVLDTKSGASVEMPLPSSNN